MFDGTRTAALFLRFPLLAAALVIAVRSATAGDVLVYISGASGADNVYVIEPGGEGARRITDNDKESGRRNEMGSLSAASNGTRVAYPFSATVGAELRVTGLDGHGALVVKQGPMESSFAPAWSPDGERLAFLRSEGMFDEQVFVVNSGGGGLAAITSSPEHKVALLWSPDGEHLAFRGASPVVEEGGATSYSATDLWVIDASGGEPRRLNPVQGRVDAFAWSPDGASLVYALSPRSPDQNNVLLADELYVVSVSGGDPRKLTEKAESYETDPCWSPDGRWIAFRSVRDGGSESIYVMRDDGTEARRLTDNAWGAEQRLPRWSPSGDRIAYGEKDGWTLKLWTMAPDGSDKQELADNVKEFVWPSPE